MGPVKVSFELVGEETDVLELISVSIDTDADNDNDTIGDACDPDDDNDGVADGVEVAAGRNPLVNEAAVLLIINNM